MPCGLKLGCAKSEIIAAVALSEFRSVENFSSLGGEDRVRPVFLTEFEDRIYEARHSYLIHDPRFVPEGLSKIARQFTAGMRRPLRLESRRDG